MKIEVVRWVAIVILIGVAAWLQAIDHGVLTR